MDTREIGATGLRVTTLGVGGAPVGNNVADHEEDIAISAVQRSYRVRDQVLRHGTNLRAGQVRAAHRTRLGGDTQRTVCHFHEGR